MATPPSGERAMDAKGKILTKTPLHLRPSLLQAAVTMLTKAFVNAQSRARRLLMKTVVAASIATNIHAAP